MPNDSGWLIFVLVGFGGLGIGLGLVLGAFVVRMLRRYMRDEGMNGGPHR